MLLEAFPKALDLRPRFFGKLRLLFEKLVISDRVPLPVQFDQLLEIFVRNNLALHHVSRVQRAHDFGNGAL